MATFGLPVSGVLESPDDFEASEDVYDAVGGVLLECVESNEEEVKGFCETLYALLSGIDDGGKDGVAELAEQDSARLLDAPVQLSTKLKVEGEECGPCECFSWAPEETVVDLRGVFRSALGS